MVAGVVALMLEKARKEPSFGRRGVPEGIRDLIERLGARTLDELGWQGAGIFIPRMIKSVLKATATDVGIGASANNHQAIPNLHDLATGAGVVNAAAACEAVNLEGISAIVARRPFSLSNFSGREFPREKFFV
jgi:hypothetical protein